MMSDAKSETISAPLLSSGSKAQKSSSPTARLQGMLGQMKKKASSVAGAAATKMSKAAGTAGSAVRSTLGSAKANLSTASPLPWLKDSTAAPPTAAPRITNTTISPVAAVEQLQAMGFSRKDAIRAIHQVGAPDVGAAAELLCQGAAMPEVSQEVVCSDGSTPARRGAAAEAAERRLAAARARNGGTMDEWRRARFERQHQQPTAVAAATSSVRSSAPATTQRPASVLEADEQEDIQQAMRLSMVQAQARAASGGAHVAAATIPHQEADPAEITEALEQMWKRTVGEDELALQQALMDSMNAQQDEWNCATRESCSIPLPGTSEWAAASSAPPQEQVAALTEVSKMFAQEKADRVKSFKAKAMQSLLKASKDGRLKPAFANVLQKSSAQQVNEEHISQKSTSKAKAMQTLLKASEEGRLKPAFANVLQKSSAQEFNEEQTSQKSGCEDGSEPLAGSGASSEDKAATVDPVSPSRHGLVRCGA